MNAKLVLIEWEDSAQPVSAWHYLSEMPKLEIVRCVSVGWLVGDMGGVKMLAPNIGDFDSGENAQASGYIRIPSSAVTRVVELKEVD